MNIDQSAWMTAIRTEMYSDIRYMDHKYVMCDSHFIIAQRDAEAGDPIAQMIMSKYVEARLVGEG